jgi:hypothetical protein
MKILCLAHSHITWCLHIAKLKNSTLSEKNVIFSIGFRSSTVKVSKMLLYKKKSWFVPVKRTCFQIKNIFDSKKRHECVLFSCFCFKSVPRYIFMCNAATKSTGKNLENVCLTFLIQKKMKKVRFAKFLCCSTF